MKEMEIYAIALQNRGFEVTSQWVFGAEETLGESSEGALMDWHDVKDCDLLICFNQPRGSYNMGGGRHTELGMAYALNKAVWIVGDKEQIFHHLPGVIQFKNFEHVLEQLKIYEDLELVA